MTKVNKTKLDIQIIEVCNSCDYFIRLSGGCIKRKRKSEYSHDLRHELAKYVEIEDLYQIDDQKHKSENTKRFDFIQKVTIKGYVTKLESGVTCNYSYPKISLNLKERYRDASSPSIYVTIVNNVMIGLFTSLNIKSGDKIKLYNVNVLKQDEIEYSGESNSNFIIGCSDEKSNIKVLKRYKAGEHDINEYDRRSIKAPKMSIHKVLNIHAACKLNCDGVKWVKKTKESKNKITLSMLEDLVDEQAFEGIIKRNKQEEEEERIQDEIDEEEERIQDEIEEKGK